MAGNAITGRDGDAKSGSTQISEVTKWSFNPKVNIVSYASNKTAGYKQRIAGVKEGTGTIEGVWDPALPAYALVAEGITDITLKLYINATQFWQITGIIESFTQNVNIDVGELVTWSASFLSKGVWTAPVAALMLPDSEALPEGIVDPNAPVFAPVEPLQFEGETAEQALARLQDFYAKLKLPDQMEEIVRRVSEQMKPETVFKPDAFDDMVNRAAEKAAAKLSEGLILSVTDAILLRLKDVLPPVQAA